MQKIIFISIFMTTILFGQTLTISTGEWQPWVSETLRKDGVAIDIVKTIFKSQSIDTEISFYPWKRSFDLAKKGKFDASAIWFKTEEREKDFLYSNPIFSTQNVIIYKKGKKIKFSNFDDLKTYKIALTRSYSYGKMIDSMIDEKSIKIKWVNNDILALKQLEKRDNFDIFICAKSVAKSLITDNFKDGSIFIFHPKPIAETPLYLIVSKKVKDAQNIIDSFNKGLIELQKKGLVTKMIDDLYKGKYR